MITLASLDDLREVFWYTARGLPIPPWIARRIGPRVGVIRCAS